MNVQIKNIDSLHRWVVFKVGGAAPAIAFETRESADTEALTLSGMEPGQMFLVAQVFDNIKSIVQASPTIINYG